MISYEKAKSIAMKQAALIGATLDTAAEFETFYMFDDSKNEYCGWIPMAVFKEDGHIENFGRLTLDMPKWLSDTEKKIAF